MKKGRLLFTGYYGHFNTGDDAFCVISDWAARKYWNQNKIKFLGTNLPTRIDESNLSGNFLKQKTFKGQSVYESIVNGFSSSKIIYSGGSIFHSEVKGVSKNNIFRKFKQKGLVDLAAIGVSLGPYKNTAIRNSIKDYLKTFSFLALRDKRSYEDAMDMNLSIPVVESFDLAAILPLIYPIIKIENKKPVLGVSVCNYERFINNDLKKEKNRLEFVVDCINELIKIIPDIQIKVLVFNAHPILGDIEISNRLIENISKKNDVEIVNYNKNTYFMWKAVSECDAVLSTRLHAGIFSCFSNTPFIQIEYHKKCSDFLDDINYPNNYRIGDFDVTKKHVCNKLIELFEKKTAIVNNLDILQQKALQNFIPFKNQFNNLL